MSRTVLLGPVFMRRAATAVLAALTSLGSSERADAQKPPPPPEAASVQVQPAEKDPEKARQLARHIPGWGHLYAGERVRGVALLGLSTAGLVVAFADCKAHDCWVPGTTGIGSAGVLLFIGTYVYGIVDADDAVRRRNAAVRRVGAWIVPSRDGGVQVGIRITLGDSAPH